MTPNTDRPGVIDRAFAKVLSGYVGEVDPTNTWGDALFAMLSTAPVAAGVPWTCRAQWIPRP